MKNRPLPPNEALAPLLYQELHKLLLQTEQPLATRAEAVYQLLQRIYQVAIQREKLPFSTHFARMAYAGHKFSLSKALQYHIHQFRRRIRQTKYSKALTEADLELGFKATADLILGIWGIPPYEELAQELPLAWPQPMLEVAIMQFRPHVRVLALEDDPIKEQLLVRDEAQPEQAVYVQYNLAARNEAFTPTIQLLRQVTGFPITLNLLDVEVDSEGIYRPQAFILEPDYLIDVSAVADAFQGQHTHPWGFLLKKFLPFETSPALVLGNIANYFLDQLMTNPEVTFKALIPTLFGLNPLAFCTFTDGQVREMMGKAQGHFVRLKQMVRQGFEQEGIHPKACYLEPTFFSEQYGLQGRLDLLYQDTSPEGTHAIVELKSGRPFMPNIHGISPNHYIQTVLYDLLVRSAFGRNSNVGCYILYSGETDRTLRFAPTIKAQQYDALQIRNQLVAIEYLLAQLGIDSTNIRQETDRLFRRVSPERFPHLKGFTQRDLKRFTSAYNQLSKLERSYFGAFSGFIAREHLLAKTGVQGEERLNGLADLWLNHPQDKEQNYQRLAYLELAVNQSQEKVPLLLFLRTTATNSLANFRVGDICVLFPGTPDGLGMLQHQVFKCTITALDAEQVTVRLRSQQFNPRIFQEHHQWNIEHDLLDGSFISYYRGLFAWAEASPAHRQLLLTQRPPATPVARTYHWPSELTQEQRHILDAIISAEEYFLLWGPPGTGKTSKMLHHLVQYLLEETNENLLLLAYTNRAVDEICEAIEEIGPALKGQYLRIGSNYGTHPKYQDQLLQNAIERIQTRRELRDLIQQRRIFVGTVASVSGKEELFALKSFDRVIIDEASQLLEPLLVGLLPRFPKWVLIGDHRQLPAVVTQPVALTKIKDGILEQAGITDMSQSLFERLYLRAQAEGWEWAYAQLTHQGRMHADIMHFPAEHFYQGQLSCLPPETLVHLRQQQSLALHLPPNANVLEQQLAEKRVLFIPTPVDHESPTLKTNQHEARLIIDLIRAFQHLRAHNDQTLAAGELGIITPYRAQIAQIRSLLETANLSPDDFTIDTVERYQGGARQIILISLCTNAERQLEALSSMSQEGVDRKLNVAMTRAREHLVILGNPEILQRNPVYYELLRWCGFK